MPHCRSGSVPRARPPHTARRPALCTRGFVAQLGRACASDSHVNSLRQASPFGLTMQLCPRHEGAGPPVCVLRQGLRIFCCRSGLHACRALVAPLCTYSLRVERGSRQIAITATAMRRGALSEGHRIASAAFCSARRIRLARICQAGVTVFDQNSLYQKRRKCSSRPPEWGDTPFSDRRLVSSSFTSKVMSPLAGA